jgi:hypothetical protein
MDARELRIGNWFANREGGFQQATIENLEYLANDKFKPHQSMQPISLTEKIIKGCKGITDNGLNGCEFDLGGGSVLWFLDPEWFIANPDSVNSNLATPVNLPYVHSLQNLYFALTGKELEFKTLG